jgi:tripartite-type tricarboxylate transporter receptor subunit TctC
MQKRTLLLSAAAIALWAVSPVLSAQGKFHTQPIKLIVPYPAGGGTDFFARSIAQGMGEELGQPVVVENRPGASGMIGAQYVAKSAPADGHTVLLGDMTTYAVNPTLMGKQQPYDIQKDLAPITLAAKFNFMLMVNPKVLPVNNLQELIGLAAKSPAGLNYGNPGTGTTHHLATELLARETGMKLVGIPYKGGGPAVQDLLAGQIGLMVLDRASAKPHIEAGKLRAIAIVGPKRFEGFPDVPTVAESGFKGFGVDGWQGLAVRAGTPDPALRAISAAFAKSVASPEMRAKLASAGIDVTTSTPAQFAAHIQAETERWANVIRTNGIKAE